MRIKSDNAYQSAKNKKHFIYAVASRVAEHGLEAHGLQSKQASVVAAHELDCFEAYGILVP